MVADMKKAALALAIAVLPWCAASSALAGPLDEAKARAHLEAVAASDLDALMRDYPDDAYMEWVGGPLDGRYHGKEQIRVVWQKFIAINEGKPRPAQVGKVAAFSNPRGASVEARAAYQGKVPMKVWHVLTYREGQLTTETWQIAPALQVE
jgi:ketosteroid isomerase-like protein